MFDDADERVGRAQPSRRRFHFRFADGRIVMEQLALKIVRGDLVEVGDPEGADARGREIKRRRTAESAGADDEHARRGIFL